MIKKKKLYRVFSENELWDKKRIDFTHGIWCTDNFECRDMGIEDAFNNSECIIGCVIDESIKDCLVYTFFDRVNYSVKEDTFVEIPYGDLLGYCEQIKVVSHVGNDKQNIENADY